MKKIIIFNSGSSMYGAERGLINLVKALKGEYEIEVVLPKPGPLVDYLTRQGLKVTLFPLSILVFSYSPFYYFYQSLLFFVNFLYFSVYISLKKFDLIYTNNALLFFPASIAFVIKKKHIWHIREFFQLNFINRFIGLFVRVTNSLPICQSENIRQNVFRGNLKSASRVIYEGIDIQDYQTLKKVKEWLDISADTVRVALVSRIHSSKGHYEALQLMAEIYKSVKHKVILLFVGDSVPRNFRNYLYKKKIENFIACNGLANRVLFCGFKEDIVSVFNSIDICIFPYQRNEPFGLALLEALVLLKPVLLSLNPGSQEIFNRFNKKAMELNFVNLKHEIEMGRRLPQEPVIPEIFSFCNYKQAITDLFANILKEPK